ncbi:16S rRNA (guanine(527)-N(7))-methyltransferase RsmG [Wenxinia marina]|uniref:Ribosomal RNA small subunit methyltransferase G n=1 Tax=Wenxinia marina DSM 24838 TaxID=1123501 RepID=A0A0D0QFH4_9RHOB|nr:16S rRNA (guanine(527)-N(7))-methyltransferase RsmG [Wenxinia marina]KIQ71057.1 16S rRNA methyltransferase [Wenxinia marina DSM 24838]GGL55215.1 ribosomal RNA small subunit methyltransferase G [Wenxinia marina]
MMDLDLPGMDVSRETRERLLAYVELLRKWTKRINLIAPSTAGDVWQRHILDSAQLATLHQGGRTWGDLGSGGGLPGLVVAILQPGCRVTLVESDARKCAFLQTARRELGLSVEILSCRIEDLAPLGADVVSARALAPLTDLIGFAALHLAPDGIALFPKGRQAAAEIAAARASWDFALTEFPSMTDPEARILKIERPRRV